MFGFPAARSNCPEPPDQNIINQSETCPSVLHRDQIRGPTMHDVLHSTKKDLQLQSRDIILLIWINDLQISPVEL